MNELQQLAIRQIREELATARKTLACEEFRREEAARVGTASHQVVDSISKADSWLRALEETP